MQLPDIKPGQVFALETEGERMVLTPVKKAEPKVIYGKLSKDGRGCVMPNGEPVPADGIADAIKQERDAQTQRAVRR